MTQVTVQNEQNHKRETLIFNEPANIGREQTGDKDENLLMMLHVKERYTIFDHAYLEMSKWCREMPCYYQL